MNDGVGVEKDRRREDFPMMHNAERERLDRDHVHANTDVLAIETTDEELFAIEPVKAGVQCRAVAAAAESQRRPSRNGINVTGIPATLWHR